MVTANLYIKIAEPDPALGDPPARYVIDGERLRNAAAVLHRLIALGWTVRFDPTGVLDEGYVEWIATKTFAAAEHASDELLLLQGVGLAPHDAPEDGLLYFEHAEGELRLQWGLAAERCGRATAIYDQERGPELAIPIATAPARTVRTDASADATGPDFAGSYVRICEPDGREVPGAYWSAERWSADPPGSLADFLGTLAGARPHARP
jgi:hypothetical protein